MCPPVGARDGARACSSKCVGMRSIIRASQGNGNDLQVAAAIRSVVDVHVRHQEAASRERRFMAVMESFS